MRCLFPAAEAEITCRSCQPGTQWHTQELLLQFDTAGLQGQVQRDGDRTGSTEAPRVPCAPDQSAGRALVPPESVQTLRAPGGPHEDQFGKMKVPLKKVARAWTSVRAKRSSPSDEVQNQEPAEGTGSAPRATRSEPRWSGEERKAAGPRHEEPRVNSSTFALTGDSSHNQAMVHWSGQNSSVSPAAGPQVATHTSNFDACACVCARV